MATSWHSPDAAVANPVADFRLNGLQRFFDERAFKDAWWTLLLELGETSLDTLTESSWAKDSMLIPPLYDERSRADKTPGRFMVVYARKSCLDHLNAADGAKNLADAKIESFLLGTMERLEGGSLGELPPDFTETIDAPPGTVVTAVIDNGIAFANNLFRTGADSRVEAAWIMGAPTSNLGKFLDRAEINTLLNSNMHQGLLDEDAFYRDAHLIDYATAERLRPAAYRTSHGTHVMGLFTGSEDGPPDPPRPIICVDLPTSAVDDPSGADLLPPLKLAILYILIQANRFHPVSAPPARAPLVVNFSYGNFAGPHDGTGRFASVIDKLLAPVGPERTCVLLPAGNGNLSRCHARVAFDADGPDSHTLNWRIEPDDRSASYVELWMPCVDSPDENLVNVQVTTPNGDVIPAVGTTPGSPPVYVTRDGDIVAIIAYSFVGGDTNRGLIEIGVAPTFSDRDVTVAWSGVWKIEITRDQIDFGDPIQCRIRRDETLPGFPPFGRQSYFDQGDYVMFDETGGPLPTDPPSTAPGAGCLVKRAGTLSGFATGDLPAVIAGLVETTGQLAVYSAAGPISPRCGPGKPDTPQQRDGPDAAAPSDTSPVLHGVLSAGSRSGSLVAMNGTSVAAPQAAHWVASPGGQSAIHTEGSTRKAVEKKADADNGDYPPPRFPPGVGSGPKFPKPRAGAGRMRFTFRIGPDRMA